MKKTLLPIVLLLWSFSSSAQEVSCKDFEGDWVGSKAGSGYQGAITIRFDSNCSYEWIGTNGPISPGKLQIKAKNHWYTNQAGSRGLVTKKENELYWVNVDVNVYTGNSYEVKVIKK